MDDDDALAIYTTAVCAAILCLAAFLTLYYLGIGSRAYIVIVCEAIGIVGLYAEVMNRTFRGKSILEK